MIDVWTKEHGTFQSEADVEMRFVLPLLQALGHELENIVPKQPVLFREGRSSRPGRKPEADFVVYSDKPHCRATALLVVETKHPKEKLDKGRAQAESYAQNLRSPLYLMTNGDQLEVWQLQIVGESELVYSGSIRDLASARGALESLASRDSSISLSRALRFKNMDIIRRDLSAYEISEIERCRTHANNSVPRYLSRSSEANVAAEDVLDEGTKGAIILGPSGYGKTTLGRAFLIEAWEKRLEGSASRLPFEVFLPDVPNSENAFEAYLVDRVVPHVAQFNSALFKEEAKSNGILIIADAFERLESAARQKITTDLRNFVRDYPKTKVLILSRPNCIPDIDLPTYRLTGFNETDLKTILRAAAPQHEWQISRIKLPDHLKALCEIPLLSNLIAKHWLRYERFPTNVATLYEEWLGEILRPSPAVERGRLRLFLEELALETSVRPISVARSWEIAKGMDISPSLQGLTEADAISIRGTSVELIHEGLADFLRAQRLLRLPLADLKLELDRLDISSSSQLPGLLLSGAQGLDVSRVIWLSLAKRSMLAAISSLKFTIGDRSAEEVTRPSAYAETILSDILSGIDALLDAHFSQRLAGDVRTCLVGASAFVLGIEGQVKSGWINFSFFDAGNGQSRVRVGNSGNAFREWGVSLEGQGYAADAGRILGARKVAGAIKELIEFRFLKGGPVWREEIVFGRLRHLGRAHKFKFEAPFDLESCLADLIPFRDRTFGPGIRARGQVVDVDILIEDINQLIAEGTAVLGEWWVDPRNIDLSDQSARKQLARTFDIFIRRRQQAYVEIVGREMPGIAEFLPEYLSPPVRYDLEGSLSDRDGVTQLHLDYERRPVAELSEAGADLSFPDNPHTDFSSEAMNNYVSRTESILASLGRSRTGYRIIRGGMSVPYFNGRSYLNGDREDETAVVSSVMRMLRDDCQNFFTAIPEFRELYKRPHSQRF